MKCCKCEKYHWEDGLDIVHTDKDRNRYCVFHAPKDEKGISVEDFNELVFARIDDFKDKYPIFEGEEQREYCNCVGIIFPGDVSFRKYSKENQLPNISFAFAAFSGDADFGSATFSGTAGFYSSVFSGAANFSYATFSDNTNFYFVAFSGYADFVQAVFSGDAYFISAAFSGAADFSFAIFSDATEFFHVVFSDAADFYGCNLGGPSVFRACTFKNKCDFRIQFILSLLPVRLQKIESCSFANLFFTAAEVDRLSFICCELPECLFAEYDNVSHFSGGNPSDYWKWLTVAEDQKEAEELYRALKQKADKQLVSKWHYREKRMALRQLPRWRWPLSATGWYGLSSGYGERPVRASLVLLAMIALTMFCLNWIGLVPNSAAQISENGGTASLLFRVSAVVLIGLVLGCSLAQHLSIYSSLRLPCIYRRLPLPPASFQF